MLKVLNYVYDYRTEDGFDPSKLFHRKVNKRIVPDYYDTIKEPVALSSIKKKINTRAYQSFAEFVRDFALIPHNAQVFNRPDSGAFQDALVIKELVEKQLHLLVNQRLISQDVATLPYLGEIPAYEEAPAKAPEGEAEDEEDSEEDEEEEDDEEEPDLDDEGKPKRKRGRPRGTTNAAKKNAVVEEGEGKRPRGRPPRLLTPMEARIVSVLKGLRKPKNDQGQLIIRHFDRLPDKTTMPEYYAEIKHPIAFEKLKKNVKRKKYASLEAFMADVNLMINNAKEYNTDDSQIFKDAVVLQSEAAKLAAAEQAKPDESFADEDGKIPMPNGILHNGELYKVGNWVHIQNRNDLTKPVPGQVYRTYKNPNGQAMVNVCWYYRPEQTVHRFDKHFYPNEIVKTGRYKDHNIEEVEGKCFVMFYTRFFKGRPRGEPEDLEVYVCKDRYNEERAQFNTIKTWSSCLPDEVREQDYQMNLFEHPRKMKKFPTPIAGLLKDDQKETDELPKPQWGVEGAPPRIGAIHRRPRTEKDSPPPEPTPPPPPKVDPPAPKPAPPVASSYNSTPAQSHSQPRPSGTGTRHASFTHPQTYHSPAVPSPAPQRPPSAQHSLYPTATPQGSSARPSISQHGHAQAQPQGSSSSSAYVPRPSTNYRDPPPIEVYTLPDQANLSIPPEIREQYQRDAFGRVLFFTAPPLAAPEPKSTSLLGHSVRYLAAKARWQDDLSRKRKERDEQQLTDERVAKKTRLDTQRRDEVELRSLQTDVAMALQRQITTAAHGGLSDVELQRLAQAQQASGERWRAIEANERKRTTARAVNLVATGFKDDWHRIA